jgi:hypothetical protein
MEIAMARRTNVIALAAALAAGVVLMFAAGSSQAKPSQGDVSVVLVQVNGNPGDIGAAPDANGNDDAGDISIAPETNTGTRDAGDVSIASN